MNDIRELIKYMRARRDHAKQSGSAICKDLSAWELVEIVAALEYKNPEPMPKE